MNAVTAAASSIQIRKSLAPATGPGSHTSWASETFSGSPRMLKRDKRGVRFLLAGRTFLAAVDAWNGRHRGYIEATELR